MGIDWTQLNPVDWGIILLLLVVIAYGAVRGLGKTINSLIVFGVSFVGAQLVSRILSIPLSNYIDDPELLILVPFGISFFFFMIIFNLFFSFLIFNTGTTPLSRLLGVAVSIPLALVQLLILLSFAKLLTLDQSNLWLESQFADIILNIEFYWETYIMNNFCDLFPAAQCYPY